MTSIRMLKRRRAGRSGARRCRTLEVVCAAPSFRVELRSGREILNAGASPNTTPVASESSTVNRSTRISSPECVVISERRGSSAGVKASSSLSPQYPSTKPIAPPVSASRLLSVSN